MMIGALALIGVIAGTAAFQRATHPSPERARLVARRRSFAGIQSKSKRFVGAWRRWTASSTKACNA